MLDVLLDPDRRAEAVRDQRRLARKMGHRVVRDAARLKHVWGAAREQNVLSALQPDEFTKDQSFLYNQLAEACAAQGRFAEAASVTTSTGHAKEYQARAAALAALNTRCCDCPEVQTFPMPDDAKGRQVRTLREIERIWTELTGRILIMRCSICRTLSAFNG